MITCIQCGTKNTYHRLKSDGEKDYRLCVCRECDYWWEEVRPHSERLFSDDWRFIGHGMGKFSNSDEQERTRLPLG